MAEFTEEELAADAATFEDTQEIEKQDRARDESGRFAPVEKDEAVEKEADEHAERPNGKVPHQALHQEREGHKQTKAQLEAAQAQLRTISEMRQRILSAQPEQITPKSEEEDPNGLQYLKSQVETLRNSAHERDQREQYATVEQRRLGTLHDNLVASENEYVKSKPDYHDAAQHLINARQRQLSMLGVQGQQLVDMLREEASDLTETAINQGRDPADLIYEYAQSYGYTPQNGQQSGNAMLDAIARGQKGRTLAGARGGSSAVDPNANAIANMDEAEFSRLYSSDSKFRELADRLG